MKMLIVSIPLVALPALSFAAETCSIEVVGLLYHYGECRYSKTLSSDRSWSIEIGSEETKDGNLGYWALMYEQKDGSYEGHWNGAYGVTRAHNRLGEMIEKDDCWVGENSQICLGVPFGDVPTYQIIQGDEPPRDNTVEANVNGTHYVIDHDSWEDVGPYKIGPTEDLDGDGHSETIVELFNGGNCCAGELSVISYRGDGFFEVVNDQPLPNGWGGYDLVQSKGETLIRVHDTATGVGNIEEWESQTDYVLRDGQLVKQVERFNSAKSVSLMELTAKEVREAPGQTKSLKFDLDLDGELDIVTCKYWDRWGSLSCDIQYAGESQPTKVTCKRFAILPKILQDALRLECN